MLRINHTKIPYINYFNTCKMAKTTHRGTLGDHIADLGKMKRGTKKWKLQINRELLIDETEAFLYPPPVRAVKEAL